VAEHLVAGRTAENTARRFLEHKGLRWLTSNYRCRYGELDLVMNDRDALVIVEIRYRRHTRFMNPVASVTRRKRDRIALATLHYLQRLANDRDHPVRFDVVGVSGPLEHATVEWIRGAFTMEDTGTGRYA
jgi:putative endonuclease